MCSQMGSLLRFPSLHDVSHHREECSAVQAWSCQRQECECTDLHTIIHTYLSLGSGACIPGLPIVLF